MISLIRAPDFELLLATYWTHQWFDTDSVVLWKVETISIGLKYSIKRIFISLNWITFEYYRQYPPKRVQLVFNNYRPRDNAKEYTNSLLLPSGKNISKIYSRGGSKEAAIPLALPRGTYFLKRVLVICRYRAQRSMLSLSDYKFEIFMFARWQSHTVSEIFDWQLVYCRDFECDFRRFWTKFFAGKPYNYSISVTQVQVQ